MQCIAKPGPVYSFLWHIWHLKCFAFWCCIRIFSSSKSLLQYLLKAVKETFNPESDLLYNTKLISIIVIFSKAKKPKPTKHRKHLWAFKAWQTFQWCLKWHLSLIPFSISLFRQMCAHNQNRDLIPHSLTHAFQALVISKWIHSFAVYMYIKIKLLMHWRNRLEIHKREVLLNT